MTKALTNIEELTSKEWHAAAGYKKTNPETRAAWRAGEDPTEHRAENEWAVFVDATERVHVCGERLAAEFTVFAFGAYGTTYVAVGHGAGRNSLEACLEVAAECLLEVAPGMFAEPDYKAARDEITGETGCGDDMLPLDCEGVVKRAETGLTYTESGFIPSWEWTIVGENMSRAGVRALANRR